MTKNNDFAATIADSFDRDLHADLKADYVLANPPLVARDRCNSRFRDRRGEMLFIDAREPGTMMDRSQRELTDEDIAQGANPYHAWRGDQDCQQAYEDLPGACKQDDRTSIPGGDCFSRYVDSGLFFGQGTTMSRCNEPLAALDDFEMLCHAWTWRDLFPGRAEFCVSSHQQWVAWVRAYDDGRWADWLGYAGSRYGYIP